MVESLFAVSPLGTRDGSDRQEFGCGGMLTLSELPLEHAIHVQFDSDDAKTLATLAAATGLMLRYASSPVVSAGGLTALWLGPGSWLIKTSATCGGWAEEVERSLAATESSAVEVSDLWFTVRLEGRHSSDVLSKGCALDLHPAVFPPGYSAVTQLARIRALIHHVDASRVYHLYVERSFARYFWTWLVDAMTEYVD